MLPATTTRVPEHTSAQVNQRIEDRTRRNLRGFESGDAARIDRRLRELDEEWDIERTLEANAASVTVLGAGLALMSNRKWILLPMAVGGFLLQHATQGWCPPLMWLRRMGFRTQAEIQLERDALRALRGDFEDLPIRSGDRVDLPETLAELKRRRNGSG